MASDPFEDALASLPDGDDPFEAALAEVPDQGDANLAGATANAQTQTFGFADELQAAAETIPYAAGEALAGRFELSDVVDYYAYRRDAYRKEAGELAESNPTATAVGTGLGIATQLAGVNPVSVGRGLAAGGRALLTREGLKGAGRALLSAEGAKAVGAGAAYGAAAGAGYSEEDTAGGVALDALEGAAVGAGVGAGARGLLGAAEGRLGAQTAAAQEKAATAQKVVAFDEATAAYPEELASVRAENAAAKETAANQNRLAAEQFQAERATAKQEAKAATKAKQAAAQGAIDAEARANPLRRTGLDGKQSTLGGPKRAKARAQALVEERLPGTDKKLVDVADELSPDARLELATTLRKGAGDTLGKIRDQLGQARDVTVPVAPIREELRGAFGKLPQEVQAKGLEQLDAMIGNLAKGGQLTPAALRKLIEDSEALAKFGTPNLEAALGQARGRVFQAARAAFVAREQELIQKVLPNEAERYGEALRQYGIFSDFELGSEVFLRRANRGQPKISIKRAPRVEPVAPRAVPKPAAVEPSLKAEPQRPEFPGGEEALAAGRKLLEPSAAARTGRELIRFGTATAAGAAGSAAGGYVVGGAAAIAGERLGAVIGDKWLRWITPTAKGLSARVQKLERLKPMMEEALRKGPAEVARIHALFMAKSPDYRKAIEAED